MHDLSDTRRIGAGRLALTLLLALGVTAATLLTPGFAAAHGPGGDPGGQSGGDPGAGASATGDPGQSAGAPAAASGAPVPTGAADTSAAGTTDTSAAGATVTSALNLRAAPSTDAEILTVMPAGSVVQLGGDAGNGFAAVVFAGMSGFAASDYLAAGAAGDASGTVPVTVTGADDIVAIIYAAADAYGQSREDMLRVATCESGLDPNNVTPPYDASGLFQFLPSTWASTPYADQSVFDPVANAYAAAWMWSVGRRGEWVCQ